MAEIYVAKTVGLGGFEKLVAIKLVHPHLSADPHFVRMLIDEAKILVLLTHANIAQVFDLGVLDDKHYIAMEFVEGVDIFGLQKAAAKVKQMLPIPVVCFIVAEMLNGLDYAHRKRDQAGKPLNIVHRDISPQNILISQAGEVKLVDFGIAKTTLRGEGTEVGVIKGKYYYMSPEQAWADPMDRRSDLFSTGIVLYEMLTGRMLYGAQSIPELISKVREAEIDPPEKIRADIPPSLSKIVMKSLEREQRARYQSAMDMGEALRDFMYDTAPAFNAAKLAQFVSELQEAEGRLIEAGRNSDTTGSLRALTRDDFKRSDDSIIFSLKDLATRQEALPLKSRRGSSAEMKAAPSPPEQQSGGPERFRSHASPERASPSMPAALPKLRVPLPPPPQRLSGRAPASNAAEQSVDSVPPTEVMDVPPEVRRVSVWPALESNRPGDGDEPTEMWAGNPLKPANDETLIESQVALGFARTEVVRASPFDSGRYGRLSEELEPTSKYTAANANALVTKMRENLGDVRVDARRLAPLMPNHTPALVPPPGDSNSIAPIPPSPPIPDFGPSDRLFRQPSRAIPWTQLAIAGLFMAFGMLVFHFWRERTPEPQLEIVSVPAGAQVSVDQKLQNGVTPLRISGLEASRKYELRVQLSGYQPWEATYQASPGAVRHIAVLKAITGEVHVASEPSGADVWLDGVPIGKTPLTVSSISVGRKVRLRVGYIGYQEVRREVTVEESNLRTSLKLDLPRAK
jgi:serine/threonine protein kinase